MLVLKTQELFFFLLLLLFLGNVSGLKGFFFPGYIELFVHSESQECIFINTRFDVD
jgi:hypothetical protein